MIWAYQFRLNSGDFFSYFGGVGEIENVRVMGEGGYFIFSNGSNLSDFSASFDVTQFVKSKKDSEKGEPIWGRKIKSISISNSSNGGGTELTRVSYGSVVGFVVVPPCRPSWCCKSCKSDIFQMMLRLISGIIVRETEQQWWWLVV